MPVFAEKSYSGRDERVNPAQLSPLPRVSSIPPASESKYEVLIAGSGPAGLMLSVLLARYGITRVLSVDTKLGTVHAGQADGLQPRTLEVLQSLDLAHELLTQGCQMHEVGFWNPAADGSGIERTAFVPDVSVPARFPHEITIHQGRIERILFEDLERNGGRVDRGKTVTGFQLDEDGDPEFPVKVFVNGSDPDLPPAEFRTKYLIGADGAHSTIRRGMGLSLEGDTTDHIWGVVDAVVHTTFPDIRKRCAIHSAEGSIMIIPRERINGKEVLTRIYCQMEGSEEQYQEDPAETTSTSKSRARRSKITLEGIIGQTQRVLKPYGINFDKVDWWAAYQIGQRAAPAFSLPDRDGILRVHIAGDACHTHSPKAGQGMNVSMMDSYNLSWKLAHVLNGLAPPSLLETYQLERLDVARQLIEFDTKFSGMFSGRIGAAEAGGNLTHEEFVDVFRTGGGFTSGCGIEYRASQITSKKTQGAIKDGKPELGLLWTGRRLFNVRTMRFADANPRNIQDDFASTGVYRILLLLPQDFVDAPSTLASLIETYASKIPGIFPTGVLETGIVFPGERRGLEWTDFPPVVRERWEWLLFGDHYGEIYTTYGVDVDKGAVAVARPDGYVGFVAGVGDAMLVEDWLKGVLIPSTAP